MMVRARGIYILMIKVNKLNFILALQYFLKEIENMFSMFLSSHKTLMKVWENSKKLWKDLPTAGIPTAFLILPNFPSCFYNPIETRYVFLKRYVFLLLSETCKDIYPFTKLKIDSEIQGHVTEFFVAAKILFLRAVFKTTVVPVRILKSN